MKKYFFCLFLLYFLSSCSALFHSGSMNKYYLKKNDFSWKSLQSREFIIYYQANSLAEKNLSLVETKIKTGIENARKFTKIDSIKTPIYYFVVDDKEEFARLTKLDHTGLSYSKSNTIIESYFLLGESHEVVHLITHQNWGNSHSWIMEGTAVYSDNKWGGQNLEKRCREINQKNQLIPLNDLLKNNKFPHFDSQISYPQSASLIKYLISNYGWDKFLQFWKKPDLEKIYKLSPSELQNNWLNYIKNADSSQ